MKPTTVTPVSVLVVDDSRIVRQRLHALLAEDECLSVVGEASGVEEACRLFEQRRPDAVVLDIRLADGSGLDVLRRVKQTSPFCLAIILTNFCESPFRRECQRCGADYFLHKATQFERAVELLHQRACIPPCPTAPQQPWTPPPPDPSPAARPEDRIA